MTACVGGDVPNLSDVDGRCAVTRSNGLFCDGASLPDAPFPICLHHAAKVLRYLNSFAPSAGSALDASRRLDGEPTETVLPPCDDTDLVYYVRVGDHIKVGHTTNLTQRLRGYPPSAELLAYEPGGRALETERLRQFRKGLRMNREWFEPMPELMQHIEQVRAAFVD